MKTFISVALICVLLVLVYHQSTHISIIQQDLPYNQDLAETLTSYCVTSYCNPDNVKTWTCGKSCDNHKELSEIEIFQNVSMHTFGYVAYNKYLHQIVAVFRGTENIKNAKEDSDTIYSRDSFKLCFGCEIHSGFNKAFQSIQTQFESAIIKLISKYPQAKILMTGHSLGGAMATLAASYLIKNKKEFTLYTLGSPRVGNKEFVHWFETNRIGIHYRITNFKDPVVHVPPTQFGFQHIPQEVFYNNQTDTGYQVCQYVREDKSCADQYHKIKEWKINDHLTYLGFDMASEIGQCMNQTQLAEVKAYIASIETEINEIKNLI